MRNNSEQAYELRGVITGERRCIRTAIKRFTIPLYGFITPYDREQIGSGWRTSQVPGAQDSSKAGIAKLLLKPRNFLG